ncbi:hypothetical protein CSE45_4012 [Citreicella sp. SE45]|nr:hypothetical protein CSE45_4012 [Citreicella sp. SE45]
MADRPALFGAMCRAFRVNPRPADSTAKSLFRQICPDRKRLR